MPSKKTRKPSTRPVQPQNQSALADKEARKNNRPPHGFDLWRTLLGHAAAIQRIEWSPNGHLLATASCDGRPSIWNPDAQTSSTLASPRSTRISDVSWSPDSKLLAACSQEGEVLIWKVSTHKLTSTLEMGPRPVFGVAWSPDGTLLAAVGSDPGIQLWDFAKRHRTTVLQGAAPENGGICWSPDGQLLAASGGDGIVRVWAARSGKLLRSLEGHRVPEYGVQWSKKGDLLASAGGDGTIRIWDTVTGLCVRSLEGHTGTVHGVSWAGDDRLLASKSRDNTVRLWRSDTWDEVASLEEELAPDVTFTNPAFHPSKPILATCTPGGTGLRIWNLDINAVLGNYRVPTAVYTSAKVVLLGESNVGKSWLASQLIERRTPSENERGTTHGMRIWKQGADTFHSSASPPSGEEREIFLWDFGGQEEYQLVHQMFLHDTTLALILIDPTRSGAERDKARAWNLRLANQVKSRPIVKYLVGTQVDDNARAKLIDSAAIARLLKECGLSSFFETSAVTGRGIESLREAIAASIDWSFGRTTRPELFQRIREDIDTRRANGKFVLTLAEFTEDLRNRYPDLLDETVAAAVTDQLAGQGLLAKTQMRGGDQALILRVDIVEQYAASLVMVARNNPRSVPAVPETDLGTRTDALPGIEESARLEWPQERVVLECVAELMIRHGICFRHQGLLVFPTLFAEAPTEADAERLPHTVSLWYDFTGAIDNVYASLVAGLMIIRPFGPGRLTPGRVEFDDPDAGLCGLRRLRRPGGLAHIELFFSPKASQDRRDRFTAYVDTHLREYGVEVTECRSIKCPGCGKEIPEETVRVRIGRGKSDVICDWCDQRTPIQEGMAIGGMEGARQRDPQTDSKVLALRQEVKARLDHDAFMAKAVISAVAGHPIDLRAEPEQRADKHAASGSFSSTSRVTRLTAQEISAVDALVRVVVGTKANTSSLHPAPIRILHLSDLHFSTTTDWSLQLDVLLRDLRCPDLGGGTVHHLVVSGDFVDRGAAQAFPRAREFISHLREDLGLSIDRVVLVPGNHDVVDEDDYYVWRSKRDGLRDGEFVAKGDGYLARDPAKWINRFRPFSDHLYHPLFQQPYPLDPAEQGQGFPPENTQLQFLAFNSAWAVDQTDRKRSGVLAAALQNGIKAADRLKKAKPGAVEPLRIAVWHHGVLHVDGMKDDTAVDHLTRSGVRLLLHGDVHEANPGVNPFRWTGLAVLGAGTFSAEAKARPESTPGLYQVIELQPGTGPGGFSWARVHTRARGKATGPWDGWFNWKDPEGGHGRVPFFDIDLESGGPRVAAKSGPRSA